MTKRPIYILLVEDSPSDANLLSQMFSGSEKQEWLLVHVERLDDAINTCHTQTFDVVLLALSLLDSEDLETVAEFRKAILTIATVLLTKVDDEEIALQAVAKGAQDYLVKGQISAQLLMRVIHYAIERQLAEAQIEKALEQERELNQLKSNFITMTSHEFRTPLAAILLSAGFLQNYGGRFTEEKRQIHLHRIHKAVEHMARMLDSVALTGKADAGKLEFNPKLLELKSTISRVVAEIQQQTGCKHTLTFASPENTLLACMDEKLLRHILNNLLSNAIKYSPEGSTIFCELTFDLNEAIFKIQDQGIGIPSKDQKRLFETFYRATNVGNIAGTGLGLNLVKRCVDLHKGKLFLESKVGMGTTFTVKLPLLTSAKSFSPP